MPENASVANMPPQSPSVLREILKRSNRTFWSWWGIPEIAGDIETHGTAVKKAAITIFLSVIALICFFTAFEVKGWVDDGQLRSTKDELGKSQGETTEAERDRDKYQTLYNQDENAMGDLRKIANEKFAQAPPDERIGLLLKEMDSFRSDFDQKIQNLTESTSSASQPIASVAADVTLVFPHTPQGSDAMVRLVGLGVGDVPLLIATSEPIINGNIPDTISVKCDLDTSHSPYLGRPISSLRDAKYIQILVASSNINIAGGSVRWTINGNTALTFDIPPQTITNGSIFIRDLEKGLMPLSSVPNTSTSHP